MNEVIERGPVKWAIEYEGIRGGAISLHICKNRTSFVKRFILIDNESFNIAIRICKEKVAQILHLKNQVHTDLARIANYCIDSTSVEEMTTEERDRYLGKNNRGSYGNSDNILDCISELRQLSAVQ